MSRKNSWIGRASLVALGAISLLPFACGGSSKPAPQPAPQPSYAPMASSAPTMAPTASAAPTMAPAPSASAAPSANPSAAAATLLLTPLASKHAPGMQPEGQPLIANLAEGQHADMAVSMVGGKCYTIIGASPPAVGVKSLEINLLTPPLYTISAGKSTTSTNEAVVGGGSKPTCPLLPVPVAYKVDVVAKSGAGPVAVQVYSKAK